MENKLRHLGWKNYRLFILLVVVIILVIGLFAYSINLMTQSSEKYLVASGSTLLDKDYNLITLDSEGEVVKNFDGNYLLSTTEDDGSVRYNLGHNSVAYADNDYKFYLFGTSYRIDNDASVKKNDRYEEVSKNTPAFYKLGDRKYLLADRVIRSREISLNENGYLIVELDRQGNATLVNNKINIKTINPIIIKGTYYDFDVSHEKLIVGNDEIDLTNVIGSTNEHEDPEVPEEEPVVAETTKDPEELTREQIRQEIETLLSETAVPNTSSNSTAVASKTTYYDNYVQRLKTSFNNLYGSTSRTSKTVDVLNKKNNVALDLTRWTNLTGVSATPTYATVNYSVFDPNNEYSQIFLTISEASTNTEKRYIVNKESNSYIIRDLEPNKKYTIGYGYILAKVVDEDQAEVLADSIAIVTPRASTSIKIDKITSDRVYYSLTNDSDYILSGATIQLLSNGNVLATTEYDPALVSNLVYQNSFPHGNLGRVIEVRATNLTYGGTVIDKIISSIYINE